MVKADFSALRTLLRRSDGERAEPAGVAGLLAAALVAALGLGAGLRVNDAAREAQTRALDDAHASAAIAAERANALLVRAWGALEAASLLGGGGPIYSDPGRVAAAAATADGVTGALVLTAQGQVTAQTAPGLAPFAVEALRLAGERPAWAGVARAGRGGLAAVLVRRVGNQVIVSVLKPEELAPPTVAGLRAALTDADGHVLAATAGGADLGEMFGLEGPPPALETRHLFTTAPDGEKLALGFAGLTGGLRLYVALPASAPAGALATTALSYALLLGAPTLGALLAMLFVARRETVRADAAEDRLDQARRQFRLAVDGARAGVWTWRRHEDQIEFSERLQWMLGATETSLPLARFIMLAIEDDRGRLQAAFAHGRLSGALEVTFRVQGPQGLQWVELRGVAVQAEARGAAGEAVMVGTALDATPQHRAELRTLAVERRLKAAIESYSGPFAVFDHRRRLVAWNRAFAIVFRLGETVLRRGAAYEAVFEKANRTILDQRQDQVDPQAREIEVDEGVWFQLVERTTQEGGLVVVGVDISALKKQAHELAHQERVLRAANQRLQLSEGREKELRTKLEIEKLRAEEANRAKTAFLHNMSHELRTPLNAIKGFSEIMANEMFGSLGNAKYSEYARDIHASGELLMDMINDILDMARIEAGKFNLNLKPLDPSIAVEQALRLMRGRAEEKALALNLDAVDPPEITADHRALKQITLNLLSNALKFTQTGGVQVRMRGSEDGGLLLQVADTGPGIPPDALKRLGQPFEQAHAGDADLSRSHSGTGLGLAITKTLVELHGGSFEIRSVVGQGTVVTIRLPAEPPVGADQAEPPPTDRPLMASAAAPRRF